VSQGGADRDRGSERDGAGCCPVERLRRHHTFFLPERTGDLIQRFGSRGRSSQTRSQKCGLYKWRGELKSGILRKPKASKTTLIRRI